MSHYREKGIDFNQMNELIIFVKSSYQRDLYLASIKRIKPFNGKVGQRDATTISGSCRWWDTTIALWNLAITTTICENIESVWNYWINVELLNKC